MTVAAVAVVIVLVATGISEMRRQLAVLRARFRQRVVDGG